MVARTLLFDLDGTLWDSYPWYATVFNTEVGLPIEEAINHFHTGYGVIQLAATCGLPKSRLIKACCESAETLNLYPEVRDVLNALRERGTNMGVVTNLSGELAESILVSIGISRYFTSLIYAAKKPSPSGINKALAQLQHDADTNVYYIGDTLTDSEAARRANIPFAWASFGYLQEAPPHTTVILNRFTDILAL